MGSDSSWRGSVVSSIGGRRAREGEKRGLERRGSEGDEESR